MSSPVIYSSIGILGGGQLGKMLAQAGADWNLTMDVLDPAANCPASCCAHQVTGDFRDYNAVMAFGRNKELITIEIEDVNLQALVDLSGQGIQIYPSPVALELIQDKGLQKIFYRQHDFPTSEFTLVDSGSEMAKVLRNGTQPYPFVQKLRKAGYDGRGVQIIKSEADTIHQFDAPSVIEEKINIDKEIAVVAARNIKGEVVSYEPVEMIFHPEANLLLYQECPAAVSKERSDQARQMAEDLIKKMDVVGLLAVEFFIDRQGRLLINEVAPRPHNSGHHTIEASITSQYHQHWRCILGLPLGSTESRGSSILLNLLGEPGHSGPARYQGMDECLAIPGVYIHLYGKKETKPYRKMGHVTLVGNDPSELRKRAAEVRNKLKVIT